MLERKRKIVTQHTNAESVDRGAGAGSCGYNDPQVLSLARHGPR